MTATIKIEMNEEGALFVHTEGRREDLFIMMIYALAGNERLREAVIYALNKAVSADPEQRSIPQ